MEESKRKIKTITGIKWSMLGQLVVQISNLVIGILLTRFLTPNDFGLIAMITVFTGLLAVLQDFGLGSALIYKKNVSELDYNTIFYAQLTLGFLFTIITILSAKMISSFYNEDSLILMTKVISLSFVIQSFSYVQLTMLNKKMDFKSIFFLNTMSIVVSGIIAIVMALNGFGVWSIVTKVLIMSLVQTIILWIRSQWKPKFIFSKRSLRESLDYSLPIVGNKTIGYFMRNSDNLIIGKFLGTGPLGIYSRAYALMMLPVNQISGVLSNVLFPSFSLINHNINLFSSNWIKANKYLSFILFPFSTLMLLLASPFTIIVLGEQWKEVIPIIQILAFAGVAQALFTNVGYVFRALGLTKLSFRINFISSLLLIIAIFFGIQFGLIGIAISYTVATILFQPPIAWYYVHKKLELTYFEIFQSMYLYLIVSIIGGLLIFFINNFTYINMYFQLIIYPIMFLLFYLFTLNVLKDETFKEIILMLKKK